MKIRKGFVSNSSSTSFCIYGTWIEGDKSDELYDLIYDENLSEPLKLKVYYYSDIERTYIGREWSDIGDNETGKQFREGVEKDIKSLNIGEHTCESIQESWYNG